MDQFLRGFRRQNKRKAAVESAESMWASWFTAIRGVMYIGTGSVSAFRRPQANHAARNNRLVPEPQR